MRKIEAKLDVLRKRNNRAEQKIKTSRTRPSSMIASFVSASSASACSASGAEPRIGCHAITGLADRDTAGERLRESAAVAKESIWKADDRESISAIADGVRRTRLKRSRLADLRDLALEKPDRGSTFYEV